MWFMRQAGRSLPEYRALRERHSFFDLAGHPELCAEVTLQPVRRHDVDAAVLFADIMTPVLGMGIDVELVEGVGPVVERPIRTLADVERLRVPDPDEAFAPVLEAIRLVRAELPDEKAMIGFCGGPFTVAGYLVEGRPSRELPLTKRLMLAEPEVWHALMDEARRTFAALRPGEGARRAPTRSSSSTRGSACSRPSSTASSSRRGRRAILAAVDRADDPLRHRRRPPARRAGAGRAATRSASTGASRSTRAGRVVGPTGRPGEPRPGCCCSARGSVVEREAADVLQRAGGRPGHVFNLGHGVLPETDPDVLTRLVELVRERTEREGRA